MKVIADSFSILWYLADSPLLSEKARHALEDAEATDGIWLSAVALVDIWYASQRREPSLLGRQEYERIKSVVEDHDLNYHVLPFDLETSRHVERVPMHDLPDFFDRVLMASALHNDLPVITGDQRITRLGVIHAIW